MYHWTMLNHERLINKISMKLTQLFLELSSFDWRAISKEIKNESNLK